MLTLCLYLLVRSQVNLRSESFADTFNLISYVHNEVFSADDVWADRLALRLTYRSVKLRIKTLTKLQ